MMKPLASVVVLLWLCGLVIAQQPGQQHAEHNQPPAKKAVLMTGLGDLHHPVSTSNAEAQKFFDQGLRLIYAFNHEEAAGSFERAAELDPKTGHGVLGHRGSCRPELQRPGRPDRFKKAHEAIAKAGELAANASPSEKAYIAAMAQRFPADPSADKRQAAERYRNAMGDLVKAIS